MEKLNIRDAVVGLKNKTTNTIDNVRLKVDSLMVGKREAIERMITDHQDECDNKY
jgi:hypothetical protein